MRPAGATLISYLLSKRPFWNADLFTYTLRDATVYRWTSSDQPVTSDGNTWLNQGPLLQRSSWSVKNTLEIPELVVNLSALDTDFVEGQNIKKQIHNGLFDGARVRLDRAFMPVAGDTSLGTVLLFEGRQSGATINATGAVLTAKGENVLMNQPLPRNLFMTGCGRTLYDGGCTMLKATFTFSFTVDAGATRTFLPWTSAPSPFAPFGLGFIEMTSGAANGQRAAVDAVDATGLYLSYPLYDTPAPGDTFTATYGCDKTKTTCNTVFSNLQHWRAFPFTPEVEAAV